MHLRLFELAKDQLRGCGWNVLGGIISPTHDDYKKKKPSLDVSYIHRINMVELSLTNYEFVKCSKWEAVQDEWTRTREVLEEHLTQINRVMEASDNQHEFPHLPDSLKGLNRDGMKHENTFKLFMLQPCQQPAHARINIKV